MNTAFSLAALLGVLSVQAQTTTSPTPPTPALTPGSPALLPPTSTPVVTPGSGALTTPAAVNRAATNPPVVTTNLTTTNLSALLTNLQSAVAAVLPTLAAFNDNFNFISTGVSATGITSSLAGTNFGIPFGANASTVTGTAVTNAFGIPPGLTTFPASRDTLRALLVLQNDLQRLLPLVEALNGGTNTPGPEPTFGFTPVPITNLFVLPGH